MTNSGSAVTLVISNRYAASATFSGAINATGTNSISLVKAGNSVQMLAGANGYSGSTTISGGSLLVNNLSGSATGTGAVAVNSSGTLGGTGIISGPVTLNIGGTLAPGNPFGTLTIANNLTLAAGSTTVMSVQHSPPANSAVNVSGTLAENGTLVVNDVGAGGFIVGDSFKLFTAGTVFGAFTNVVLPTLTTNLVWNTNALNVSGTLAVAAYAPPTFGALTVTGNKLICSGTGGIPYWTYFLLAATNLTSATWMPVATNAFDASGNFIFTNVLPAGQPQTFIRLELQ